MVTTISYVGLANMHLNSDVTGHNPHYVQNVDLLGVANQRRVKSA